MTSKSIKFITLTNSGYLEFTLNLLQSLKNINYEGEIECCCIDQKVFDILEQKGAKCSLIEGVKDNKELSDFHKYRWGNWGTIMSQKYVIIYENLLKYDYVCYADGDIVFEDKNFMKHCLENINDNDFIAQDDKPGGPICAGFMFIKSNDKTKHYFNLDNMNKLYNAQKQKGDQTYVNLIASKLKYKLLPKKLYPNGHFFFENHKILKPHLIHFNWCKGLNKKELMKKYKKWYLEEDLKYERLSEGTWELKIK